MENFIGKFIHIEDSHLMGFDRKVPHVLVEMEMENGLPKDLEVVWEGGTFMQKLDYWRVPFQFHRCRGT